MVGRDVETAPVILQCLQLKLEASCAVRTVCEASVRLWVKQKKQDVSVYDLEYDISADVLTAHLLACGPAARFVAFMIAVAGRSSTSANVQELVAARRVLNCGAAGRTVPQPGKADCDGHGLLPPELWKIHCRQTFVWLQAPEHVSRGIHDVPLSWPSQPPQPFALPRSGLFQQWSKGF